MVSFLCLLQTVLCFVQKQVSLNITNTFFLWSIPICSCMIKCMWLFYFSLMKFNLTTMKVNPAYLEVAYILCGHNNGCTRKNVRCTLRQNGKLNLSSLFVRHDKCISCFVVSLENDESASDCFCLASKTSDSVSRSVYLGQLRIEWKR